MYLWHVSLQPRLREREEKRREGNVGRYCAYLLGHTYLGGSEERGVWKPDPQVRHVIEQRSNHSPIEKKKKKEKKGGLCGKGGGLLRKREASQQQRGERTAPLRYILCTLLSYSTSADTYLSESILSVQKQREIPISTHVLS